MHSSRLVIEWSTVAGQKCNRTTPHRGTFEDLAEQIEDARAQLAGTSDKSSLALIGGAFRRGPHDRPEDFPGLARWRLRSLAEPTWLLMLDVDKDPSATPEQVLGVFDGLRLCAWSTYSHGVPGKGLGLRVVIPYARGLGEVEHKRLYAWAARRLAAAGVRSLDLGCSDITRIMYLPGGRDPEAKGAPVFEVRGGEALDPDALPGGGRVADLPDWPARDVRQTLLGDGAQLDLPPASPAPAAEPARAAQSAAVDAVPSLGAANAPARTAKGPSVLQPLARARDFQDLIEPAGVKWAQRAMGAHLAALTKAPKGDGRRTAYAVGAKAGALAAGMVGVGWWDQVEADRWREGLAQAALDRDPNPNNHRRSFEDGWKKGEAAPVVPCIFQGAVRAADAQRETAERATAEGAARAAARGGDATAKATPPTQAPDTSFNPDELDAVLRATEQARRDPAAVTDAPPLRALDLDDLDAEPPQAPHQAAPNLPALPTARSSPLLEPPRPRTQPTKQQMDAVFSALDYMSKEPRPRPTLVNIHNVYNALGQDLMGSWRFNFLTGCVELEGEPCWLRQHRMTTERALMTDAEARDLVEWLHVACKVEVSIDLVWLFVFTQAQKKPYDPLADYLVACEAKWDGIERAQSWLVDFAGAQDTPAVQLASQYWLVSAVARALCPGEKVDYTIVLEGKQGGGKSSIPLALVPDDKWATGLKGDPENKETMEKIRGKWIVELAELAVLGKGRDMRSIKDFLTTNSDRYREPWARVATDHPRRCVFIGTVNPEGEGGYLSDPTGNRRWWPVAVADTIDLAGLRRVRDQLWGEAVARWRRGEMWYPQDTYQARMLAAMTEPREEIHPWTQAVLSYLDSVPRASNVEIAKKALGFPEDARVTSADARIISAIVQRTGRYTSKKSAYAREWVDTWGLAFDVWNEARRAAAAPPHVTQDELLAIIGRDHEQLTADEQARLERQLRARDWVRAAKPGHWRYEPPAAPPL